MHQAGFETVTVSRYDRSVRKLPGCRGTLHRSLVMAAQGSGQAAYALRKRKVVWGLGAKETESMKLERGMEAVRWARGGQARKFLKT